jgi:hypothetical protein
MTAPQTTMKVAELLEGDVDDLLRLPRFDPRVELREVKRTKRKRRCPYMSAAAVDAQLAPFRADAEAGVPDALIAKRSGRTSHQVQHWRHRNKIYGRKGRMNRGMALSYLLGGLIAGEPVLRHDVSPVRGEWSPPAYVLREKLSYDLFARTCHRLVTELSYTISDVARAIGVRERDVDDAVALFEARGAR